MKEMMAKAGNLHLLEVLTYPDAGHLIEPPYTPHIRASNFIFQDKEKGTHDVLFCFLGADNV